MDNNERAQESGSASTDQRLRSIFNSAVDFAVIGIDLHGIVTDWNPGAENILRWSASEMVGQDANLFFTREDRAEGRMYTEMRCAREAGRASDERWHLRKDGSRFWASGEMMPLLDSNKTHVGYLKILRDSTAKRIDEGVLRSETDFLKSVLASSADCIKVLTLDGRLVYLSEGGHSALEVENFDQIQGKFWPDLWPDAARAQVAASIDSARVGEGARFQAFAPTLKGTEKYWDVQVSPIRGRDGTVSRLLSVSRDVTDVRSVESKLARSQERLQAALNASDMIGIWDWDIRGDVVYADAKFAKAYDVDPQEAAAGAPLVRFLEGIHPDDQAMVAQAIDRALKDGADYACEYRLLQKGGEPMWISARGIVIRDEAWQPLRMTGAGIDITARKRAEEAVQDANRRLASQVLEELAKREVAEESLRQSQKMEAVGQLTGGLAHDFNNLLTSVGGSLELVKKRGAQGRFDQLDKYLDIALGATQRAAALTHRLLAFSRQQTLDPKPTNVNWLVEGMAELINRTIGPEITLTTRLDPNLWSSLVDPSQLDNALLNLCINARDAMPNGGTLNITTFNYPMGEAEAGRWAIEPGEYVAIDVKDDGGGMPPEVIKRVFEPFFTTKPSGRGTGLGLSMVYGFAKQSGGDVRIRSFVNVGTTVTICLPRHHIHEVEKIASETVATPLAQVGQTVLVVDDEPLVRMLLVEVLQEQGYTVLEAGEGPSATAILQSEARIDLLVTDVGLPGGMNGRQIADAMRVKRPDLPVLFVTGYAEKSLSGELPARMHVLTKPFAMDLFVARVEQLIDVP
ncbi:PAS domain S-box protein [uncultured Xylophilus sp.]|uniref:PAS domain S-box protein n=1 Tax=uncultured Xylophilus sp. TaxID=296832 RepID=UPI0025F1D1EA|nr:PAS domain S-box protein [uncultured Xylophilus sp.]